MSEETEDAEGSEQASGPSFNAETLRSYVRFTGASLKGHRGLAAIVISFGALLTFLVVRFIPRTYSCTTELMTVENAVLDGNGAGRPLAGAEGLLTRHENLEALVDATNLAHTYGSRRPPLLRAKDRAMTALFGAYDAKVVKAIAVGTLESALSVKVTDDKLEIRVEWRDPDTAAELAQATEDGFLKIRHATEISAFQEKLGILDAHASGLRVEISALADQINEALEAKAADLRKNGGGAAGSAATGPTRARPIPLAGARTQAPPTADAELGALMEKLAASKQKLTTIEGERNARISAERAKLDELKLRFTPNHPQVIAQQERVAMASDVPSDLAVLRAEVADLEVQLKQRNAMAKTGPLGSGRRGLLAPGLTTSAAAASAEMLPADIIRLLASEDADPALAAQMSGAVVRYGALRDEMRGAKLALDTAQAAFNHRYQIVTPVEVPSKPTKPNLVVIGVVGILLSLLLALGLPIFLELKRGVLEERWQVEHLQLPVLAELRLPGRVDR